MSPTNNKRAMAARTASARAIFVRALQRRMENIITPEVRARHLLKTKYRTNLNVNQVLADVKNSSFTNQITFNKALQTKGYVIGNPVNGKPTISKQTRLGAARQAYKSKIETIKEIRKRHSNNVLMKEQAVKNFINSFNSTMNNTSIRNKYNQNYSSLDQNAIVRFTKKNPDYKSKLETIKEIRNRKNVSV